MIGNEEQHAVSGRKLHETLEIPTRYNDWAQRTIQEHGFIEGFDFYSELSKTQEGGRPSTDHVFSLDSAKHISMTTKNEKGRQLRQYFIEVEWASRKQVISEDPSKILPHHPPFKKQGRRERPLGTVGTTWPALLIIMSGKL